jgi:outer membrane protein OmpA-like peptidoglycan-associated protein
VISRAVLAAALAAGNALAQAPEVDPDSAQEHRRAVQALPSATVLPVAGASLEILPVVLEVKGIALGVKGDALGVDGLLRDLNAEVRGREVRIAMSADVLFDFDKADLRKEARPELEKVAAVLKEYPGATARIEGHADGKGDAAYNQKLSERRAEAIRKWLADEGVKTRLSSKGWGKTKPVAPNVRPDGKDNPEGRQKNRRVEIVLDRP